jgi:HPt (histidine-containing phosphotransfer) domain-containing protein
MSKAADERDACGNAEVAPPPIDRKYLSRFTMGNPALEREVLELFAAQTLLYLDQLRSAQTRKAWSEAAHTIKGSAAAVGAARLAGLAETAEKLDIAAECARSAARRERELAALAVAIDEARGYIARLYAG